MVHFSLCLLDFFLIMESPYLLGVTALIYYLHSDSISEYRYRFVRILELNTCITANPKTIYKPKEDLTSTHPFFCDPPSNSGGKKYRWRDG